ncbi:hypothetical protein MPER_07490, partial [Moniliophthora perniciosa FA553]
GWLRTGDQVLFNEEGDIFIVERIKELIKVKGLQVPPAELEGHLLMHASVADAAVIGVPDEYTGELPLAFIVLQPEIAAGVGKDPKVAEEAYCINSYIYHSILRGGYCDLHVAAAKSRHKWLMGGIIFIESIPRNASGKILRRLLRKSPLLPQLASPTLIRQNVSDSSISSQQPMILASAPLSARAKL